MVIVAVLSTTQNFCLRFLAMGWEQGLQCLSWTSSTRLREKSSPKSRGNNGNHRLSGLRHEEALSQHSHPGEMPFPQQGLMGAVISYCPCAASQITTYFRGYCHLQNEDHPMKRTWREGNASVSHRRHHIGTRLGI